MNYQALEDFVLGLLRTRLPHNLFYHNYAHTIDVMQAAVQYCEMEQLSEKDTLLVKTAALIHDAGFMEQYDNNEPIGARMAGEWLPAYGYPKKDIEVVQKMILATAFPRNPEGLFEKIICDADLDYLGRDDFFMISQGLRHEWMMHGRNFSLIEWYELERNFLSKHVYYSDAAFTLRNKTKMENLEQINALLEGLHKKEEEGRQNGHSPLDADRRSIVTLLKNTSLFAPVEDEMLEEIARMVDRIRLKEEEPVFRKGEIGESMYIVEKGHLRIHDGDIVFKTAGPGEYFGELALISATPRTASVTSVEESVILRLGMKDFYTLLTNFPSMNRMLMKEMINRLKNQNETVVAELKSREAKLKDLVELRTAQIVEEKKNVEKKSAELELALKELKEAQHLLIHQEKMASIGQLTTGMAHELLNPLNFVNNFSAVSVDLLGDVKETEDIDEIREICQDVSANLEKILQHGKRAGEIVRSMSEHTGSVSKEKSEFSLHDLLKDAVSMVHQSMLSELKDLEITTEFQLNAKQERLQAAHSELFRMVANVVRNAYSAILDRSKSEPSFSGKIVISTHNEGHQIIIDIFDNGIGISDSIRDKIFNPFFTTRPTGQGVGLGLSIAHQIASAFGGSVVHLADREETLFQIRLPL